MVEKIDDPCVREVVEAARAWRCEYGWRLDAISGRLSRAVDALDAVTPDELRSVASIDAFQNPGILTDLRDYIIRAARTIERLNAEVARLGGGGE